MNVIKNIEYNYRTNLYRVAGGSWLVAWDFDNEIKINEFGFRWEFNTNEILITSDYELVGIIPTNFPNQYDMLINGNVATFTDMSGNHFIPTIGLLNHIVTFDFTYNIADEYICLDINNNNINRFVFGEDGIIYGYNDGEGIGGASIGYDCCTSLGYFFDPNSSTCYWSTPCDVDNVIKILINPEGDDGVIFEVSNNQNCILEVEFDYLLEYNCDKLLACSSTEKILEILSGVSVTMSIERVIPNNSSKVAFNQEFELNLINESVYESVIFDGIKLLEYLSTENSGIFLNGGDCQTIVNMIQSQLPSQDNFSQTTLFSNWLHFKVSISDDSLLNQIKNEKIKLGLKIENSSCDMSILIDNIQLNRICQIIDIDETFVAVCPTFELDRVIDNKKSWVAKEITDEREFDLTRRETDYNINHYKLGINTKELDLNVNPSTAIETDVMQVMKVNECLSDNRIDLSKIFTLEDFKNILLTELIDAKSRQTIRDYPMLRAIFDRYLNSLEECGIQTNSFNYSNMDEFISLIGTYWVELIEQVIPSTTIWGSTYKYNNTVFDNNKFKYRKSTLFVCQSPEDYPLVGSESNIEVISTNISSSENQISEKCNGVYISQISDGSEFIGSVSILGANGISSLGKGDIIILNESFDSLNN